MNRRPMKRTAIVRKPHHKRLVPKKRMKRVGEKTLQWNETRRKLKPIFEEHGITRCERCGTDEHLSFAHRIKRRFITTQEELETVALLCMPPGPNDCHGYYERMSHEDMFNEITAIINKRG